MVGNNNKSDQAKKGYTGFLSEEEIEKELSLIFESQICSECGQDHSFKNDFENVKTSMGDFLKYFLNNISGMTVCIIGGK